MFREWIRARNPLVVWGKRVDLAQVWGLWIQSPGADNLLASDLDCPCAVEGPRYVDPVGGGDWISYECDGQRADLHLWLNRLRSPSPGFF